MIVTGSSSVRTPNAQNEPETSRSGQLRDARTTQTLWHVTDLRPKTKKRREQRLSAFGLNLWGAWGSLPGLQLPEHNPLRTFSKRCLFVSLRWAGSCRFRVLFGVSRSEPNRYEPGTQRLTESATKRHRAPLFVLTSGFKKFATRTRKPSG